MGLKPSGRTQFWSMKSQASSGVGNSLHVGFSFGCDVAAVYPNSFPAMTLTGFRLNVVNELTEAVFRLNAFLLVGNDVC